MNKIRFIIITLLIAKLFVSCSTPYIYDKNIVYFMKFDLFTLSGSDTIPAIEIGNIKNKEFIKVDYSNGLPQTISYHFPEREVILKRDSSILFKERKVYVYSTGNLLGGKAGKQRDYSFHYTNNGYKLFVNLSDTIFVKSFDNTEVEEEASCHYMVDVYIKENNFFSSFTLLQEDTKVNIREDSLYKYWFTHLLIEKLPVISRLSSFPPK